VVIIHEAHGKLTLVRFHDFEFVVTYNSDGHQIYSKFEILQLRSFRCQSHRANDLHFQSLYEDFDQRILSIVKGSGDVMRSRVRMELKRANVISRTNDKASNSEDCYRRGCMIHTTRKCDIPTIWWISTCNQLPRAKGSWEPV
jgi:hypothetical protein